MCFLMQVVSLFQCASGFFGATIAYIRRLAQTWAYLFNIVITERVAEAAGRTTPGTIWFAFAQVQPLAAITFFTPIANSVEGVFVAWERSRSDLS